jgi:hypothetical protein
MAQHSCINHHVDGMNYICLLRTDELTIKIYMMGRPENPNNGFLVNPHSHRYPFDSTVLCGELEHIRFHKTSTTFKGVKVWSEYQYSPETREIVNMGEAQFFMSSVYHTEGGSYFVKSDEIHTLRFNDDKPVIIGLTQFADEREHSELYLPREQKGFLQPNSRCPTVEELEELKVVAIKRILEA